MTTLQVLVPANGAQVCILFWNREGEGGGASPVPPGCSRICCSSQCHALRQDVSTSVATLVITAFLTGCFCHNLALLSKVGKELRNVSEDLTEPQAGREIEEQVAQATSGLAQPRTLGGSSWALRTVMAMDSVGLCPLRDTENVCGVQEEGSLW